MPPCLKCFVGGVVEGSGMMPSDDQYELVLTLTPDGDDDLTGVRSLSFSGRILRGNAADGYSIEGDLTGDFGIFAGEEISAPATVEIYHRDGVMAAARLAVSRANGGFSFVTSFERDLDSRADGAADAVKGFSFQGWPEN